EQGSSDPSGISLLSDLGKKRMSDVAGKAAHRLADARPVSQGAFASSRPVFEHLLDDVCQSPAGCFRLHRIIASAAARVVVDVVDHMSGTYWIHEDKPTEHDGEELDLSFIEPGRSQLFCQLIQDLLSPGV